MKRSTKNWNNFVSFAKERIVGSSYPMTRVSQWLFLSFFKNPLTFKYIDNMNQEKEIWKPVVGFEGLYEVSNLGNVRSIDRVIRYSDGRVFNYKGKIRKPTVHRDGYLYVMFSINRSIKNVKVHRLVAEAFIPNPETKTYVDHIDTNRKNNKVSNLRWVTAKENANNSLTKSKRQEEGKMAIITSRMIETRTKRGRKTAPKEILQINDSGAIIGHYNSITDASKKNGFDLSFIAKCVKCKNKKAYGCYWITKHEYEKLYEQI